MLREIESSRTALARPDPGRVCQFACNALPGARAAERSTAGPTEFSRTDGRSLCTAPLFPAPSGNVASKVQVGSTVRQVASILGVPLDTPAGGHRCSAHNLQGHTGNVPRVLWDRRVENPVAWPLGLPCCPEARAALHVGLFPMLAANAELAELQASRSLRDIQGVYQHSLRRRGGFLGRPSVPEVLAPRRSLVQYPLPERNAGHQFFVTAHSFRCLSVGTDLVALRGRADTRGCSHLVWVVICSNDVALDASEGSPQHLRHCPPLLRDDASNNLHLPWCPA